jgi:hypothetical protein
VCVFREVVNLELAVVEKLSIYIANGFYKYARFKRMMNNVKILVLIQGV